MNQAEWDEFFEKVFGDKDEENRGKSKNGDGIGIVLPERSKSKGAAMKPLATAKALVGARVKRVAVNEAGEIALVIKLKGQGGDDEAEAEE